MRASKTIADERAVVQKESAAIRASFREESHDSNVRYVYGSRLIVRKTKCVQAEQCRQTSLPIHSWRTNAFRSDRMPETTRLPALCRQEIRILGDYATAGREPGGTDSGYKFVEEVQELPYWLTNADCYK